MTLQPVEKTPVFVGARILAVLSCGPPFKPGVRDIHRRLS